MRVDRIRQRVQSLHLLCAAHQPAGGTRAGCFGILIRCRIFHTFVKSHGNRRSQIGLDLHAFLRPDKQPATVHMRGEGNALFLNFTQSCQRKNLKSAAVGQQRPIPAGESVYTAQIANQLIARAHMQMIGVAQLYLTLQLFQIVRRYSAFDSPTGCYIHKSGGLHRAVRRFKYAAACRPAGQ